MNDCVFCKIAQKHTPAQIVTEDENIVVFKDIHPNAPIHFLLIPKEHVESMSEVTTDMWAKLKDMMLRLAKENNLDSFRIVSNWGNYQTVKHLHIHYTSGFTKEDF